MNMVKLLAAVAVLGLAGTAARADDKADVAKKIVGAWTVAKADPGTFPPGTVLQFQKDGTVKVMAKKGGEDVSIDGSYKLDGKALSLTLSVGGKDRTVELTVAKVSDAEMTIAGKDDKKVELTKKK